MGEMAKELKDEQIEALADYFSTKPGHSHRVRDKALAAVGEYIFLKGNQFSGIPACALSRRAGIGHGTAAAIGRPAQTLRGRSDGSLRPAGQKQ